MRNQILVAIALCTAAPLSAESLWTSRRNNEAGMFADRISTRVGDILLIKVDESTVVNRSTSKTTSSSTTISHDIDSYLFPASSAANPTQGSNFGTHNRSLPSINISPNDSFSGEGSYSDSNVLEAMVAVLIVDVLPNGNLVIEGARKVEVSGESQYLVMRGIVRRDDVKADNSVMSYQVVNANVEMLGSGDLVTAQRKNWINQLLDAVNIL